MGAGDGILNRIQEKGMRHLKRYITAQKERHWMVWGPRPERGKKKKNYGENKEGGLSNLSMLKWFLQENQLRGFVPQPGLGWGRDWVKGEGAQESWTIW